ncbi:MAG TPA: TonB-dependent receptor [Vicinamibacterales bacterium]|nr:TonB-dependent receptor [Vicinamibacterales bacterium]
MKVRQQALLVMMAGLLCPAMSLAQIAPRPASSSVPQLVSLTAAELRGTVVDERSQPLAGVVISALGGTSAFAVSDRGGHFVLRDLPAGPYLVRAHLQGYTPARGRIVQVSTSPRDIAIALTKVTGKSDQPQVLQAGIAGADGDDASTATDAADNHSELAWRLRHIPRSVLKDVDGSILPAGNNGSFMEDSLSAFAKAVGSPVRFASDFIADLPLNGQINLLTSTSFDRPQNLFSMQNGLPNSVAFVSLTAPTTTGKWDVRGGTTQGDLSSWIVAGSYSWQPVGSSHSYRAGMSYAMQRYLGGNADALAAMADGRRNAGEMYAFDRWAIASRLDVSYGARYARYDYLSHETLFSPKASVTLTPLPRGSLRLRGTVSRREIAPGAQEFLLPSTGVWVPPGRTFSPVATRTGFRPEQINHLEIAAEQPIADDVVVGMRVFRQQVNDQLVTLFGVSLPSTAGANIGHYYVGNAGDVDARGWGVSVSRTVADAIHASVDYTQVDAEWLRPSRGSARVALVMPSAIRRQFEQLRDLTTSIESEVPRLDTRVFVIYKINSGFTRPNATTLRPQVGSRFDVEVSQALPFLNFASAQWEMLVAVRNLFHEDVLDASVYDELQVVRPPKHVVGGVTVRF